MKKILIISSLIVVAAFGASKQTDEWKVSGRLNAYIQSIDVQGESNTTKEGTTHVEELNLNFAGPLKNGHAGVEMRARTTNNHNVQTDGAELLYLHSYFRNKIWALEAGDVAASFNPYIFGGSVKGFKARYKSLKKDKKWDYTIIAGFRKGSWREVFKDVNGEAPTAYEGAFEAKYTYSRAKEIAISVASYKDDLSTGDANSSVLGKKGIGFGVNGKWRFSRYVTLKSRVALTNGTDDIKNSKPSKTHSAIYLKLLTKPVLKSVKSNFIYQRVASDFISFGGSGTKDKEQIENSTSWRISKKFRANLSLKANRDNLNGALGDTRHIYYEMLRLNYRPDFLKRGDINFRLSNRDTTGRGADNNRQIAGVDFTIRKKNGWRYGGGFEYNDYDDNNATSSSQTTTIYRAFVGYRHKISKTKSYRITARTNYQDIHGDQDKIGFKVDAGYVHNRHLSMDLSYNINDTNYESSNDTQNSTYQFRTTYKIDTKGAKIVRLLLEKRDVDVENDGANSYNEYREKLSFVVNF
ncbi:MAG: hypothetical protein GXP61_07390 [Epsilonproteobacteria bacterium]|nr:hypothetical protein [Campylobacterota bacterium]